MAIMALTLLPGCGAGVLIVYDGAKQAAKGPIGEVLAETNPAIDRDRGAECVIEGLTRREILALGTGDSTGSSPAYRSKTAEALTRPGVASCLASVPGSGSAFP